MTYVLCNEVLGITWLLFTQKKSNEQQLAQQRVLPIFEAESMSCWTLWASILKMKWSAQIFLIFVYDCKLQNYSFSNALTVFTQIIDYYCFIFIDELAV